MADEVEQFLTGVRRDVEVDRVLATVLFTDIVNSTFGAPRSLVTGNGVTCLNGTTRQYGNRLAATGARRSRHSVTAFLLPSMARRALCAAPPRLRSRCARSALQSVAVCIPARSNCSATTLPGSPCTLRRASQRRRKQGKRWYRGRCAISSLARACISRTAASTLLRACRKRCTSTASSPQCRLIRTR